MKKSTNKTRKTPSVSFTLPEIRKRLELTQKNISELFGVSVETVQNWESGRKNPSGTSKKLLSMLAVDPEATLILLRGSNHYVFVC